MRSGIADGLGLCLLDDHFNSWESFPKGGDGEDLFRDMSLAFYLATTLRYAKILIIPFFWVSLGSDLNINFASAAASVEDLRTAGGRIRLIEVWV